ncbi:MAG: ChrR family anti-sigma-E factor [Alphaproteobacteria bacterium]|nr:ChrR family anti-sigma-E factor [Alphaproteobacteria bacterium]
MTNANPLHHPSATLLAAVASGRLSPAVTRIVGAHAKLCPRCRALMAETETIAGAALDLDEGVDLAPDALDRALAALTNEPQAVASLPEALSALPEEVHDLVSSSIGKAQWRSGGMGLRILDLDLPKTAEGESFQLFRIEPGYGPPRHTHGGQEFTLVLTGAFKDETGTYKAGDIEIGDGSITHRPVAEPGEICFALAVTTAPLKFTGPLGVLQRVLNFGRSK